MAEWDNAHFLTKGLDLTPIFGSYASAIEQAIEQAYPSSTWYGGVIRSEDTPPTAAPYEWHKRCLWQKISTKRWYYYDTDSGSWEHFEDVLVLTIPDASIALSKLDPTGASPLYVLRRNGAGNAFEWVPVSSLLIDGSIALTKLAVASGAGYIPYTDAGGVPVYTLFNTVFDTRFAAQDFSVDKLKDTSSFATNKQVIYFTAAGSYAAIGWIEDLLRTNTTPTNKLLFAAGSAGKYVKVNAGRTDFEYDSGPSVFTTTAATLVDTGVSGTAAQAISATTTTQVRIATETAQTWCVVAANAFTLDAGTYVIHASIPVYFSGSTTGKGYVSLVEGASTVLKTANVTVQDNDNTVAQLHAVLVVGASTTYKFNVYLDSAGSLGLANSFATIPEVYTQVTILKIA